jgi:glycosyltransferase involved in cell wall biosynthesis
MFAMRVAMVHEWLTTLGGSELVLGQMLDEFPDADLFSLIDYFPPEQRGLIHGKTVTTSFLQNLPLVRSKWRAYLPLMPLAVEQFDLSGYDLVISNSHAVAKGVLTGPDQLHICMCYSPMRYAWDLQHQYLAGAGLGRGLRSLPARWALHKLRQWDARTANGVDAFIAISRFIARRIWKTYRREATVIYPPVDTQAFTPAPPGSGRDSFYLVASRLVPYKMTGMIVEAFAAMPERRLVVIGAGPEFQKVSKLAGRNVELLGFQSRPVLIEHLRKARALIFAAEEDFGLVPVEAMACGTPVIAFGKGGARETVLTGPAGTGVLFDAQTPASLIDAVRRFEAGDGFDPARLRAHAERFGVARFRHELQGFVEHEWRQFQAKQDAPVPFIPGAGPGAEA